MIYCQSGLRVSTPLAMGILTALMLTEEVCDSKLSLSAMTKPILLYPQYMESVRVKDKAAALGDPAVQAALKEVDALIGGKGRTLLRQSGTEPVIRVMVEAETKELCESYVKRVVTAILEGGHGVE